LKYITAHLQPEYNGVKIVRNPLHETSLAVQFRTTHLVSYLTIFYSKD